MTIHTSYLREKLELISNRTNSLEAGSSFPEEDLRDISYFANLIVEEANKLERFVRNTNRYTNSTQ